MDYATKKIPNDLEEALKNPENFDKICKIAEDFGVAGKYSEGINKLDSIFEKTLTGNLSPNKVFEEIKKDFGFSEELSKDIAQEMENQIFSKYKKSLDLLYSKEVFPITNEEKLVLEQEKEILNKAAEKKETETPEAPPAENDLEKEILKELKTKENEIPKPHPTTIAKEPDEVDNVLYKLEEEMEKEKEKMKELDEALKKEKT